MAKTIITFFMFSRHSGIDENQLRRIINAAIGIFMQARRAIPQEVLAVLFPSV
jgi:hypothetical protein